MSPRSEEYMAEARELLRAASLTLANGFGGVAARTAYFAMFNAAQAALSEEDQYAKTHKGTWRLFRQLFVESRGFDRELAAGADASQATRLGVDYRALRVSQEDAAAMVDLAERFVAAVEALHAA